MLVIPNEYYRVGQIHVNEVLADRGSSQVFDWRDARVTFIWSLLFWTEMLKDLLGAIWRGVPRRLRRWTMRASQSRFAVTAGGIITDNEGRVLLLKHRFRPSPGWGVPGGFIEHGEQPEEALRRELREEVELEVKHVKLFATRALRGHKQIEILFTACAIDDTERLSFEIQKAAWFSLDELPKGLPGDQAKLIRRALNDGVGTKD